MYFDLETALVVALAALAMAIIAGFADRRRLRRSDPDAVGWMPWRAVSLLATVVVIASATISLLEWLKR